MRTLYAWTNEQPDVKWLRRTRPNSNHTLESLLRPAGQKEKARVVCEPPKHFVRVRVYFSCIDPVVDAASPRPASTVGRNDLK
jgi:hypothetical protein